MSGLLGGSRIGGMDLRWAPTRAFARGVDAVLLLVLVLLSAWLGGRVIGAVYVNNPKVHYVSPEADRLVAFAWTAVALQVSAATVWRRWPLAVWLVVAAMLVVHVVTLHRLMALSPHPVRFAPLVPSDGVLLLALYGLTAEGRIRTATVAGVLTLGLGLCSAWAGPADLALLTGVLLAALPVAVFAGGLASHTQSAYLAAMTQRAADLVLVRTRDAELAALAERSRLAREIHDTVAHTLGIIVVQAQGGAAAQRDRPAETGKALDAIIGVGRQALAEMRGLLSTENAAEPPPRLGTAHVAELAARFREAGRRVEVTVHGLPAVLPLQVRFIESCRSR
jgi:signal transduction histidine kinase